MNTIWQNKQVWSDHRGVAALLTVIMISAAVLLMALSVSVLSIGELNMGYTAQKGGEALAFTQGCAEESLRRLSMDNDWAGGTLNLSDGSCIISVSGNGSKRTLKIVGQVGDYQKNLQIKAAVKDSAITVSSWQEVSN